MPVPNRKVRSVLALQRLLIRARVLPTAEQIVRMPMAKRLAIRPGRLAGRAPEVPARDTSIATRDGASLRLRVYEPERAAGLVLYAHGGGFVIGGLDSCDHICRRIASESGTVVVSAEYRLAPEHPFPVPLEDCEDVLTWLSTQSWGHQHLVFAGDSAGGNLAAALALRARDQGIAVAGQVLLYPALDLTVSGQGMTGYVGPGLSTEDCRLAARTYLAGADPTDPYASPGLAPDLSGLAPALVVTSEHDPLRAEAVHYAARLQEAGVRTVHLDMPGHVHGSLSTPILFDGIDQAYDAVSTFVRNACANSDAPERRAD